MKTPFLHTREQAGFTLVEIIIVAALISLFSGLATFGIQQMLKNNKLKAVIGETHQIGSSLLFAHEDVGFYPNIGYLAYNNDFIDVRYRWDRVHAMNLPISIIKGQFTYENWRGPYFAASPTRNQISTRYKSLVTMILKPERQGVENEIPWPADQWGNPYVVYLMKYLPRENDYSFIESLGEEPNFFAAVVSYGPNGVPGTPVGGFTTDILRNNYCLYRHPEFRIPIFESLVSSEYNITRADAYSLDDQGGVGIVDPGSDDIVYNIN